MTKFPRSFRFIVAALLLIAGIPVSKAAPVTWGSAQAITDDFDVNTTGTLVNAVNLGVATSPTVNGVTFTGLVMNGSTGIPGNIVSFTSGNFTFSSGELRSGTTGGATVAPFSNLSNPYQTILGTYSGNTGSINLDINGLTVGSEYLIQIWSNVSNGLAFFANLGTVMTAGNSLVLNNCPGGAVGGLGQFGVGTFIATAPTQQIVFTRETFPQTPVINAVQLRSIPEPVALLLLGLGACLGCSFGRRRQARI